MDTTGSKICPWGVIAIIIRHSPLFRHIRNYVVPAVIIMSCLTFGACSKSPDLQMIEISGADAVYNISRSWIWFGSYAGTDSTVNIAAGNGDLLYIVNNNSDQGAFLVYDHSRWKTPEFTFDTVYPAAVFVNQMLYSIDLTLDSLPPVMPCNLSGTYHENISFLNLKLPLGEQLSEWIENNFPSNQSINLIIEGTDTKNQLGGLLKKFSPRVIYMSEVIIPEDNHEWVKKLKGTTILAISAETFISHDLHVFLPSLVSLILSGENTEPESTLRLDNLPRLKNLTLINFSHLDIKWLENAGNLANLFMIAIDSVSSPNRIINMEMIRGLAFSGSVTGDEIPAINGLEWMSLPVNMTQEAFTSWCRLQKSVIAIQITGNQEITDLEPLSELSGLKFLMLDTPGAPLEPLGKLTSLELLVIGNDRYSESETEVVALKSALPHTRIVPGGGFCMGSGWILLIIPFLLLPFIHKKWFHTS